MLSVFFRLSLSSSTSYDRIGVISFLHDTSLVIIGYSLYCYFPLGYGLFRSFNLEHCNTWKEL